MLLHLIFRAVHTLAAACWVGGSLFYLLVFMPALRMAGPAPAITAKVATLFKQVVNICAGVLLVSGVYLTFDRLTTTTLGWVYILVLVCKVSIALIMFLLAIYIGQSNIRRLAKRTTRFSQVAPRLVLALGILVFVLGALLNSIYEATTTLH